VSARLHQFLSTWATQGVQGHFKSLSDSPLPAWLHADDAAAKAMAPIVGAAPEEIAIMETLTANLHFILSAFYRPDPRGRHKIIIESKAFPSDHVSPLSHFTGVPFRAPGPYPTQQKIIPILFIFMLT
jgi:kynureninase